MSYGYSAHIYFKRPSNCWANTYFFVLLCSGTHVLVYSGAMGVIQKRGAHRAPINLKTSHLFLALGRYLSGGGSAAVRTLGSKSINRELIPRVGLQSASSYSMAVRAWPPESLSKPGGK